MTDRLSSLEADHVPESVRNEPAPAQPTWEQIQAERESLRQQLEHAQRLVGEQGRQLGEYRAMLQQREQPKEPELNDDDFITNPKTATEKLLEAKLSKYEQEIQGIKQQTRIQEFERKHPEARQLLADQEFIRWANSGPHAYVAAQAARGDLEAADALLELYKSQGSGVTQSVSAITTERPTGGSAGSSGRKPISREKYRQALMRGESIPPEVMRELQEAYRNKNFV